MNAAATPVPVYVCGPTASGKSAMAVELALELGGEVVNADALQLYRGVEVLSAAPSALERERVPHHLFGVLDPAAPSDVFRFRELARPVLAETAARGATPVVVGGAGLYLKFLTHGPSPLPPGDPALRRELAAMPLAELVAELRALDPREASRTDLANRRYVARAVEICRLTGRPASDLRDQWRSAEAMVAGSLRGIRLVRPRADLHDRIARRARTMLDHGAIEEVAALCNPAPNLARAIGFTEIRALLDGTLDRPACEARIIAATRRYAKRQETWFRREAWLTPVPAGADALPRATDWLRRRG